MTFEERCLVFERNTRKEINLFKKVYRVIFIQQKKQEQAELEEQLFSQELQENEEEKKEKSAK